MNKVPESLKILFIGNSFSVYTAQHLPEIARSYGVKNIHIGVLYIGGCSTRLHYKNIKEQAKKYDYYESFCQNGEWSCTPETSSNEAVLSDDWDYIALQHGTIDGSKNTDIQYYDKLAPLVAEVRAIAPEKAKIVFNMHWVGEPWHTHPEILSFGGDTNKMYEIITNIAQTHIAKIPLLDIITPVGTAIQNARTSKIKTLNRDGYHLSLGAGRFIAALAFFVSLTALSPKNVLWFAEDMDEYEKKIAIESVENALQTPYAVTKTKVN